VKQDERQVLRDAATRAMKSIHARVADRHAELPLEWQLQTSNSFRRIGTTYGDGDVLCGTKHPRDGHPDLLAAQGVLDYIIATQPSVVLALLDALELAEQEASKLRAVCEVAVKMRRWSDLNHAHAFGCGNDRPCDACDFVIVVDTFVEASR